MLGTLEHHYKLIRVTEVLFCTAPSIKVDSSRYLHLLNLVFPTGLFSKDADGAVVRSSKFIIIKLMSSTSLLMGAITSEHRNFEPEKLQKLASRSILCPHAATSVTLLALV